MLKLLLWLFVWCACASFSSTTILKTKACNKCVAEQCPEVQSNCETHVTSDDVTKDACNCCAFCKEVSDRSALVPESGSVAANKRQRNGGGGEEAFDGQSAAETCATHEEGCKASPRLQGNSLPNNVGSFVPNAPLHFLKTSAVPTKNYHTTVTPYSDAKMTPLPSQTQGGEGKVDDSAENVNFSTTVDPMAVIDAFDGTVVKENEKSPTVKDKIQKAVRSMMLTPLQRGGQFAMNLGTMLMNSYLAERESDLAETEAVTTSTDTHSDFDTRSASALPEQPTVPSRAKRETEFAMRRIGAVEILRQVLKDGSVVLKMLTTNSTQSVIHCVVRQTAIPGSHIVADVASTVIEAIHEGATFVSLSKTIAENPTWESLKEAVVKAVAKGFVKASASIPKTASSVKKFLLMNPKLMQLHPGEKQKVEQTAAMKAMVEGLKTHLGSICQLLQGITDVRARQGVKSVVMKFTFPGHNILAELADAIMAVSNAVYKSVLESAFIREKPSWENLLETAEKSAIVGVTEGFKVAPKVIHVMVDELENNNLIHKETTDQASTLSPVHKGANFKGASDEKNIRLATLEAAKIRPILNSYFRLTCDCFSEYKKGVISGKQRAASSRRTKAPGIQFLEGVNNCILDALDDVGNIICTSRVLNETSSWNGLHMALKLVNDSVFARLLSFQSKYNPTHLKELLNSMGCNETTAIAASDQANISNKTIVEVVQIMAKYLSKELKTRTDAMLIQNQRNAAKISKLPGGKVLNIIIEIILQVVNEMSRKMSASPFVRGPPKWFNFWLSMMDALTGGATKAGDTFAELLDSIQLPPSNETPVKKGGGLETERSQKRHKRELFKSTIPAVTTSPHSSEKTVQISPATIALARTSASEPSMRELHKFCQQGKCDGNNAYVIRFSPAFLSQLILEDMHRYLKQLCTGVQDLTGFLSSLFVPPFIRSSGVPFAKEISEITGEVITLSNEVASKSLETPFLRNPPNWDAAKDFIIYTARNFATGAIRFLSFVLNNLSATPEASGSASSSMGSKLPAEGTELKKSAEKSPDVIISFSYEPASNITAAEDSPWVQELSSALSNIHDVVSVAADKKSISLESSGRTDVKKEQRFLILKFIRGILHIRKLMLTLVSVLIPEHYIIPVQQFLKQTASGISTLTGSLPQAAVSMQLKSSRLPFANRVGDCVGEFLKTANKLSSAIANSKYLNERNITWSTVNKAITSAFKSGLQLSLSVLEKGMEIITKEMSMYPKVLVQYADANVEHSNGNHTVDNANPVAAIKNNRPGPTPRPPAQKRVKREYLKRMRERHHVAFKK